MAIYLMTALVLFNYTSFKGCKLLTSLFAIELGAPYWLVGVIYSMYALFPIFLAVYAGKLGDRIGYRIPVMLASSGLAGGLLLPAIFPNLAGLAVSTALIGLSFIFFEVSIQTAVGFLPGDRTRNYSISSLGNAVASGLGPLLAGFSIDMQGHAVTYLFVAMLPVLALLLLFLRPNIVPQGRRPAKKDRSAGTWDMLKEYPDLRRILIVCGTTEAALELFAFYMPIYGHSIGLSASSIGMVMGAYAIAMIVIRLLCPWLVNKSSDEVVLRLAMLVAATAYCVFPFAERFEHLGMLACALGLSLGGCVPLAQMIIHGRAPGERAGEAMGVRHMINKSIGLSAPLVYGGLGPLLGAIPIFWACAAVLFAGNTLVPAQSRRVLLQKVLGG